MMVKMCFHFSSSLSCFDNVIKANGDNYKAEQNDADYVIELLNAKGNLVEIEINSSPRYKTERKAGFIQKIIATLVMMCVTAWTPEIYSCNYKKYGVKLLLCFEDSVETDFFVDLEGGVMKYDVNHCTILSEEKYSNTDVVLVNEIFKEYQRFNVWRTTILLFAFFILAIIGVLRNMATTVVFSLLLAIFVVFTFVYTKRRLQCQLNKVLCRKE